MSKKKKMLAVVRGTDDWARWYTLVHCDGRGPMLVEGSRLHGYRPLDEERRNIEADDWERIFGIYLAPGEWCPLKVEELP